MVRPPVRRAARALADRLPDGLRARLIHRWGHLVGSTSAGRGLVSLVVVCEGVDEPRLGDTLSSIRAQSHRQLEVFLCPVASAEPMVRTALGALSNDARFRVLPAAPDWQAAANAGAATGSGRFIGFLRGCDLLPVEAVAVLAGALTRSGSDLVTGSLTQRGQPDEWLDRSQRTAHAEPALARTPAERPVLAGDLVVGNKLHLRSAWRDPGQRFTAADQWLLSPAVATALNAAQSVDVVGAAVYEFLADHGNRPFGATPSPFPEFPDWSRQVRDLERLWTVPALADGWLGHVLDVGLPRFMKDSERATAAEWSSLRGLVQASLERAGPGVLAEVRAESRVLLWLTAADRRPEVEALAAESAGLGDELRTVLEGPNLLAVWSALPADVPPEVRRLAEHETRLVTRIQRVRRDASGLSVDLFVRVDHLDLPPGSARIEVRLSDGTALVVSPSPDPAATRWAGSRFQQCDGGAVTVRIPGSADRTPELQVTLVREGFTRSGTVAATAVASGPGRAAVVVRAVTLSDGDLTVTGDGHGADHGADQLGTLRLLDPNGDVAARAVSAGPGEARIRLRRESFGRDQWLPTGSYRLVTGDGNVAVAAALREGLPQEHLGDQHTLRAHLGPAGGLVIGLAPPLGADEAGVFAQERLREIYRVSDRPLDPSVVYFETFGGRSVTDSPLAIHHELRRRRPDLTLRWAVIDHSVVAPEGAEPVTVRSREWYDVLATAGCLVLNTDTEPWFARRDGQFVLQTFHGHPSKSMGASMWRVKDYTPSQVRSLRARSVDTWSAILTPSPEMTLTYREQYDYDGPAFEHGYPRNDDLHGPGAARTRAETRALLGIRADQTAVLYAPTWREHLATRPRAAAMSDFLDLETASRELGASHVLLVRGHRFHSAGRTGTGTAGRAGSPVLDVGAYPEVNDLLLAADVAVLDYSSLRFDFAQTGNPMVFLVPDLAQYDGGLRGFLFPFQKSAPGPFVSDTAGVVTEVRDIAVLRQRWERELKQFNDTYNRWQDGSAASRVVDKLLSSTHLG